MTEAIHQAVLYETYKRGTRERHNIRQLNTEEPPFVTGNDTEDVEIRKVGGKRFVTEERLADKTSITLHLLPIIPASCKWSHSLPWFIILKSAVDFLHFCLDFVMES
jgi:hypothetical protein